VAVFHRLDTIPVHSVVNITSFREARHYPTGDISLGFCGDCGFISNTSFVEERVSYATDQYEATQACSPTFRSFAENQARWLIQRHDLHQKRILEIGCGNGEFLDTICRLGDNHGVGFDPSFNECHSPVSGKSRLSIIKDYYSERYKDHRADFVLCRMTLEHIPQTGRFVRTIRQALADSPRTTVFFQVPDVTRILKECAFEDIYFEHCSYFSPGSLARLFRREGFEVLGLESGYDRQYVMIEARPGKADDSAEPALEADLATLGTHVRDFSRRFRRKQASWHASFKRWRASQRRVVLWGAGSKGVSFLSSLAIPPAYVPYAVDINPRRHDTYMAGTGQRIVSPRFMKEYRPSTVIVMNAVYRHEVTAMLGELGVRSEVITMDSGGAL
jgi:SAM-dependent methyltransferase